MATPFAQPSLFDSPEDSVENSKYLSQQLITYIGNKRALLGAIDEATQTVREELGGRKMEILDGFSGSGVVSRLFKRYASRLVTCDIEDYAAMVSKCYLANRSHVPMAEVSEFVRWMNSEVESSPEPPHGGFIRRLYSPRDDVRIELGERVFYTSDNGRRLDHFRQLIDKAPDELRPFLLGPLLSAASVHANTAGVFKGFYKDKESGVGRFGGSGQDALLRIKGQITMREPVLSDHESDYEVRSGDTNREVQSMGDLDLAYFDPPYNQHPYGSNYFMLNLIVNYEEPEEISDVSGIPVDWKRSAYNVRRKALAQLNELVSGTPAKFLLVSFNDEGFISPDEMRQTLSAQGDVREMQLKYNRFRGSRNLADRSTHVTEHLFLVKRS